MEIEASDASAWMTDELSSIGASTSTHQQQQIANNQLDIEAYAALYNGRTRIKRLLFIGEKCQNVSMQLEALKIAYDEIKQGEDIHLFKEVVERIDGRLGPDYGSDSSWINSVESRAEEKKKILELELKARRKSLVKESIRMGYKNFGDFYYAHGELEDAFKNYVEAHDYRSSAKHVIEMCMDAILVAIEMKKFANISRYVFQAQSISNVLVDRVSISNLQLAAALGHFDARLYKYAAQKFLAMDPDLGDCYSEVIAAQDVATYGGLCALATFDRAELKAKVIDNKKFLQFLNLVPEMRELIHDFYSSRFTSCLDYFEDNKANLLLDIYLHDHLEMLYTQIRNKALIQYTRPYVSIDLNIMAATFKTTVARLQKELETLIIDKQIQAKIDSESQILYARHEDERKSVFRQVLHTGSILEREIIARVQRANLMKANNDNKKH